MNHIRDVPNSEYLRNIRNLLIDFSAAAELILTWYDGDRKMIDYGYGCTFPAAAAVHGLTALRTAVMNAQRLNKRLPRLESRLPQGSHE